MLLNMTGVPRLVFRLMLDRRGPIRTKLILPAAIVYLILPLDIIPDILPALGRIDDILVIAVSLAMFLSMAPKDVVLGHLGRPGNGLANRRDETQCRKSTIIEGSYRIEDDDGDNGR